MRLETHSYNSSTLGPAVGIHPLGWAWFQVSAMDVELGPL